MVQERHREGAALFHLPPIPIDDVDGGGLSRETQKAERHGDGELPGATLEGRVEKPANERKIVAALPPDLGQEGDRLHRPRRSCVF